MDMSPMIDMVFLLLIFFIVNSNMVIVKMDKRVEVPVAADSLQQEDANGRIVVNVYEDGTLRDANANVEFEDDNALIDYIDKERQKMENFGYPPTLHLRGDRRSVFRHSRRVIRAAATARVDQVRFATYQTNKQYIR